MEVHQGENTYAQDNLLLGKIEISVPPKPKGKEAVDVRFTYDINGILVVDTRVVSTGVVKTHIISQKIPEAELEERVRELEKAVSMLEYYDPFEEEFDASESDWDLWDEEEAQDPDNEETDEEKYWKKEGDDHSWTS